MVMNETYELSNGIKIPKLGLGTWEIADDKAPQAVRDAVRIGYRHFDTAQGYGNERGVGEGVRTCGLARETVFVTTKLDAAVKTYAGAAAAIDDSLKKMKLDWLDLMLIHSPEPWTEFRGRDHYFEGNREAWRALEDAYHAGKLRAIGVSNFETVDLDNLLEHGTIHPMVNQILVHVSNTPFKLIDDSRKRGMLVEAYSPVGHGQMLKNEKVALLAGKYGVSLPQLCIRYCLQLGLLPLPKTGNPTHMADNAAIDFEIAEDDMAMLKNIEHIVDYGDAGVFPVFGGKLK